MNLGKELEIILRPTRAEHLWLGIRQSFWDALREIFVRHPDVEAVVVFGSRARQTHHHGSDIDLCVFGRDYNSASHDQISNEIDALFYPWKVDIIHWERSASLRWRNEVRRDALMLFNRSSSTDLPVQLNP